MATVESQATHAGAAVSETASTARNGTEKVSRSSCPMLNICANHGGLPADGHSITFLQIYNALRNIGGCSPDLALILVLRAVHDFSSLPSSVHTESGKKLVLSLEEISRHDVIEHDASLTRGDQEEGKPGSGIDRDEGMVRDILLRADGDGFIWLRDFARVRVERERFSLERRGHPLTAHQKDMGTGEVAVVLLFFGVDKDGKKDGDRVKIHRDDFLAISEDRLPGDWEKPGLRWSNAFVSKGLSDEVARVMKEIESEEGGSGEGNTVTASNGSAKTGGSPSLDWEDKVKSVLSSTGLDSKVKQLQAAEEENGDGRVKEHQWDGILGQKGGEREVAKVLEGHDLLHCFH